MSRRVKQSQRRKGRVVRAADSVPVSVVLSATRRCPNLLPNSRVWLGHSRGVVCYSPVREEAAKSQSKYRFPIARPPERATRRWCCGNKGRLGVCVPFWAVLAAATLTRSSGPERCIERVQLTTEMPHLLLWHPTRTAQPSGRNGRRSADTTARAGRHRTKAALQQQVGRPHRRRQSVSGRLPAATPSFLRQKCANMPTSTQRVERHSFRFPGPFAH